MGFLLERLRHSCGGETWGGPLFALIGSNNEKKWEWLEVTEWDLSDKMPKFTKQKLIII